MKTISVTELNNLLTRQPDLVLVDVRTPVEFAEIHVPASRNVPLDALDARALLEPGGVPAGHPVYLICRSGARASKAAGKFAAEGADRAVVVEGGTLAWVEAGLPVHRGRSRVISLERQVRIAAGALVTTGVLLGWLVHPALYGLAGFVGAGLVFAGITDFCGMGLLLARAPWNRKAAV